MPSSKTWSEPDDDDSFYDDDGNIIYFDRTGKLRKFKAKDAEYQQMYHYYEDN